jgi:hypothetical protein
MPTNGGIVKLDSPIIIALNITVDTNKPFIMVLP